MRAFGFGLVVLAWCSVAAADVLPPRQNITCPRGSEVVHGHGGTRCVVSAPKACPPGWIGRQGGQCVLQLCKDDASCGGNGLVCKKSDVCTVVEERTGWGAARSPLFAGPPMRAKARVFRDVCRGTSCDEPATCGSWGICLAQNVDAPSARPTNGGESWTFEVGTEEPPQGTAAPYVTPPTPDAGAAPLFPIDLGPPEEPRPGKSSGCAGCTASGNASPAGALGLLLALSFLRRRR